MIRVFKVLVPVIASHMPGYELVPAVNAEPVRIGL